jgi:threonine dehydrogenase-like Zn-dependent dehydrogenase
MRALTVQPREANSMRLGEIPEPHPSDGSVVVRTLAVGICGTDLEIMAGRYGWAPPGRERLVIGHESLGRVEKAPVDTHLVSGDLVVGIVRRPDPIPCIACAAGEWDMCRNGLYTERGIKQRDGYCSDLYRIEPEFAVKIDPSLGALGVLLEPASVVAKAWEQIDRIGSRAIWRPRTVLVTGAGPVGLLAALLGTERDLDVHVLDRVADGPKPQLVRDLGATYHVGQLADLAFVPDIVIECTGAPGLIWEAIERNGPSGIVCLAGVSSGGHSVSVDLGQANRTMVLENDVVFGSVNANRRHYEAAARALTRADRTWLARLVSRRVPLARWTDAIHRRPDDVKVVLDLTL